jgi:phosphoribosylglycinamide formyltransferase 1
VIGVLVSGAGTNLQSLLDAGLPVSAVASNIAGVPALERAERVSVPAGAFPLEDFAGREARDDAMAEWLAANGVELVVCAGYMQLLTPGFLARFPCINVHPSLLPAFPGGHAVEEQLAAGVAESGATVHLVDEGIDSGPILRQERVPVVASDTPESLHERIKQVEHRLLPEVVGELCAR